LAFSSQQERHAVPWIKVFTLLTSVSVPLAAGEPPRVQFDMPYAVGCRDVSPPDYATKQPGAKLIEAKFQISALLLAGEEQDLAQYFIRVELPNRPLTVADYLPKTQQESIAKAVTVDRGTENVAALGINLSGKYELLTLPGPSAGIGQKKTSSVKLDLLPPLETVAASGTLARGSAVFFKLRATSRNPLEGTREYALVLSVPANWRADYLRVRCEAEGIKRSMISSFDERVSCGQREFVVSLFQEGDEEARRLAENFSRRQASQRPGSPLAGKTRAVATHMH
jgi:hypothetical protein